MAVCSLLLFLAAVCPAAEAPRTRFEILYDELLRRLAGGEVPEMHSAKLSPDKRLRRTYDALLELARASKLGGLKTAAAEAPGDSLAFTLLVDGRARRYLYRPFARWPDPASPGRFRQADPLLEEIDLKPEDFPPGRPPSAPEGPSYLEAGEAWLERVVAGIRTRPVIGLLAGVGPAVGTPAPAIPLPSSPRAPTPEESRRGRQARVWDPAARRWQTVFLSPTRAGWADPDGKAYADRGDGVWTPKLPRVEAGPATDPDSQLTRNLAGRGPTTYRTDDTGRRLLYFEGGAWKPSARRLLYIDPQTRALWTPDGRQLGSSDGPAPAGSRYVSSDLGVTMADGLRASFRSASGRLGEGCGAAEVEIKVGLPPGMRLAYEFDARRTRGERGEPYTWGWRARLSAAEGARVVIALSPDGRSVLQAPPKLDGAALRLAPAGEGRWRSENGTVWLLRQGPPGSPWIAKRFVQVPAGLCREGCRPVAVHRGRWVDDPGILVDAGDSPLDWSRSRPLSATGRTGPAGASPRGAQG